VPQTAGVLPCVLGVTMTGHSHLTQRHVDSQRMRFFRNKSMMSRRPERATAFSRARRLVNPQVATSRPQKHAPLAFDHLASSVGGSIMPFIIFGVFRLIIRSNMAGCSMGNSEDLQFSE
jgi:hypothetical protein